MFVHGDNLLQKETSVSKDDLEAISFLQEIREKYDLWKNANIALCGPFIEKSDSDIEILEERVRLFNEYKDFIDQQKYAEKFDSRSNLHSSVLEEFMYYLFKDLVGEIEPSSLIGKSHAFKDIFYTASSFKEMVHSPNFRIEKKDHDFVIGVDVKAKFTCNGYVKDQEESLQIPAVAIECKTYLDKTMLEGSSNAAVQLLEVNPNAIYIIVAEWLKLTDDVNLKKYKTHQIYVLRKQKNTDRKYRFAADYTKNPIFPDVVFHLFNTVKTHLTSEWTKGNSEGLEKGYLL